MKEETTEEFLKRSGEITKCSSNWVGALEHNSHRYPNFSFCWKNRLHRILLTGRELEKMKK